MKKTLIGLIIAMFSFGSASADAGVNIGVSGNGALFAATATETDVGPNATEKNQESEVLGVGYASIFVEKELGMFFIGVDYVPSEIETETAESLRVDCPLTTACTPSSGLAAQNQVTNKVSVEFSDFVTGYVGVTLFDNFYAKVGAITIDIETKESLGTGGTYGNSSIEGTMVGIGGQADLPNGMFIRGEGTYMDFDAVEIASSNTNNKVRIDGLDGVSAKVSIGASF